MSDFKEGDEYYEISFKKNEICLQKRKITRMDDKCISATVIIIDNKLNLGLFDEMYKSKQECIDAFKKRLDEL